MTRLLSLPPVDDYSDFRRKPDAMSGDQIPSLTMQSIDELRVRGILVTNRAANGASISATAPTRRPSCLTLSMDAGA